MVDRFHKAARDGYLDALREATRKDCNTKDEDGMTPTLWAAFEGNLDALRLLVGRGGDPEKCDNYGNTALHLASAKGRLNCVTFLINFGVNLWDLDIDLHSAKDLAAINNREDILKYLDAAGAQQESSNPKLAKSCQEKAKKEAEKRVKNFQKIQKKADKTASKENDKIEKRRQSLIPQSIMENVSTGRRGSLGVAAFSSLAGKKEAKQGNGNTARYSDLLGGTVASRKMKGGVAGKINKKNMQDRDDNFTVRESGGTVRSLSGLRSGQVSEILFMDKETSGTTGSSGRNGGSSLRGLEAVFDAEERDDFVSEPSSIFNRPGFGSVAFRNSISAFNALSVRGEDDKKEDSIGSAGSLAHRSEKSNGKMSEVWEDDDELSDSDSGSGGDYTSLQMFLAAVGLHDWTPKFVREKIDLEALMLLSENDLGDVLGMPLGPRKKLLKAINERRKDMEEPDEIHDSRL
eukprot:TRINITY_DN36017_c0_g1_i1.p1 TRINITY_DN36017_c0_g1~~TRINITY_DN36017_c0_g1_i1.p1  ORF type:complete len:462 (-),score=160.69 TRINITY_DN36017_c0_g1_i1:134-1519(-)